MEIRVRVDRFEKSKGTVLPASDVLRDHDGCEAGEACDCRAFLCAVALSIKVLNSVGVRSPIERKCLGLLVCVLPGLRVDNERDPAGTAVAARIARPSGRSGCSEAILAIV